MIWGWAYNPPPYWPEPPPGWSPPPGWRPDPAWGPVPSGWQLWVPARPAPRRPARTAATGFGVAGLLAVALLVPVGGPTDPGRAGAAVAAAPGGTATPSVTAAPTPTRPRAPADPPRRFDSCSALHRTYPHGVGRPTAVDDTGGRPVTGFGRSTALYRANQRLDRDRDGIACEHR